MILTDSETVGLRIQVADTVLTTIDAYGEAVATGYLRFLEPEGTGEGGALFDARGQIDLLRQRVVISRDSLQAVHSGVVENLRSGDDASHDVQTLAAAVIEKIRASRDTCKGLLSEHSLGLLGVTGPLPRTPWRLYRKGRFVQASLRHPDLEMDGVLRMPEDGLTPALIADQLEPELNALGQELNRRLFGTRETVAGRSLRQQTVKDFDREIRLVIRMFHAMARLAGRDDLAERIAPIFRLATRRLNRARSQDEAAETTSSETTPPETTPPETTPSETTKTPSSTTETPRSPG